MPVRHLDGDGQFSEPAMLGPGGAVPKDPRARRARRHRRRKMMIAAFGVFIMLAGGGLLGGTYFFDNVELPADTPLPETTSIYYSDGTTLMAKIGEQVRTVLPDDQIPIAVRRAAIATEDKTFETNKGVDFRGIARAAWNNVSGGELQGASTITQQYARQVASLKGVTYGRKLREAVMARKLNSEYTKDQLIARYLNAVYFGRRAHGIEAAAYAYFGRPAKDLTVAEAMVLTGMIKEPGGALGGKTSTYDPTVNPEAAQARFHNYIKPNMVELGYITAQEAAAMEYPKTVQPFDPAKDASTREQFGLTEPTGLVVHQVMDEISKLKTADGQPMFTNIKTAGLKIVTTIDKDMQKAAVTAASAGSKASPMHGESDAMQAALVAVEPGTGRVRAYYGGDKGNGTDFAGVRADPVLTDGKLTSNGAHPPGSAMKIFTLLAGLREGYRIDSYWDGTDVKEFPDSNRLLKNSPPNPIRNSSKSKCEGGKQHCMLWEATEQSLNTPFFALAEKVSARKVIEMAASAGVRGMWATVPDPTSPTGVAAVHKDLTTTPTEQLVPHFFQNEVGIGQYPITVLDQAVGVSVLATRGKATTGHFVQQIFKDGKLRHAERIVAKPIDGLTPEMVDNANWALQKVVKKNGIGLAGGRDAAGKTGTWEKDKSDAKSNVHAWFAGVTAAGPKSPGVSAAVWVGNKNSEVALKFKNGEAIVGGKMAGPIWQKFMDLAIPKGTPMVNMPDKPKDVGDKEEGNATRPAPPQPTVPPVDPNNPGNQGGNGQPCPIPEMCPASGAQPGNNANANGNNGNGRN